ncbi:hypothetical protein FRC12_021430, partial [Ceratobasidium sp. 428]
MAQPQILRSAPINFSSGNRSTASHPYGSFNDAAHALMSELLSVSPTVSYPIDFVPAHNVFAVNPSVPEVGFVGLPPLQSGTVDEIISAKVADAIYGTEDGESNTESAFFAADLSKVLLQHERWLHCLPGVEPFYAVKCNPDPYVLRLLAALGTGFDCASHGEISQVLGLGVDPSRIIFANPCKATSFVRHAAKAGVDMMTFDNQDELFKIA